MADDNIKMNTASAMASAVSDMSSAGAGAAAGTDPFADAKSELATRYELLPDDIKAAIMDAGYQQKLLDLAKAQKLTYEELGILETETTMVLLGMTKPADYRDELQNELKKNDPEVDAIVKAVNEQVFAPVRASLERVYENQKDPADYIPDSIVSGVEDKPKEPVMPPTVRAIPTDASLPSSKPVAPATPWSPTPAVPGVPSAAVPAAPAPISTPIKPAAPASSAPAAPTPAAPAPFTTSIARPAVQNFTAGPSTLTSLEKNVLGQAGVVIDTPAAPAPAAPASEIPDRAKLLASIENPSKIAPNLIADKLKSAGAVFTAAKTTDYSMPAKAPAQPAVSPASSATPAAAPAKPYVDPYREPI